MKRFLRYFLYRELYRWIRSANTGSSSDNGAQVRKPADMPTPAGPTEPRAIESESEVVTLLHRMDPYDFEHFVADLWNRMGWTTEVSSAAMDEGVDVIARKSHPYEQTTVIQAKRYGPNTTVGSPDIQQYASLQNQYDGVDKVVVVTTNEFTGQARDLAQRLNVKLIDGQDLVRLLEDANAADLVATYLEGVELRDEETDSGGESAVEAPSPSVMTPVSEGVPQTRAHYGVAVGLVGWIVILVSAPVLPEGLLGTLLLITWIGLPLSLYWDARQLRDTVGWPHRTWAYVGGALLLFVAVVPAGIYLYRRHSLVADRGSTSRGGGENDNVQSAGTEPTSDAGETAEARDRIELTVGTETVETTPSNAPGGRFAVAMHAAADGDGLVVLLDDGEVRHVQTVSEPRSASVANDGTVVVIAEIDEESSQLLAFGSDGERLLAEEVDLAFGPVSLDPSGRYAAAGTAGEDGTTLIFELETGERIGTHDHEMGSVEPLGFTQREGTWMIELGPEPGDALYGIDLGGHVIWKSETLRRREGRLADDTETERDRRSRLEEALAYATEPWRRRNIAAELGEYHEERADEIEADVGISSTWWEHMRAAAEYYEQTMPRYAGKHDLARLKRRMAQEHYEAGDEAAAREALADIEALENRYGIQLLADGDRSLRDTLAE